MGDPDLLQKIETIRFGDVVLLDGVDEDIDGRFVGRSDVSELDGRQSFARGGGDGSGRGSGGDGSGEEGSGGKGGSWFRSGRRGSGGNRRVVVLYLHLIDFLALILLVVSYGAGFLVKLPFDGIERSGYFDRVSGEIDHFERKLSRAPSLSEIEESLVADAKGSAGVGLGILLSGAETETEGREEDLDIGSVEQVVESL